MPSKCSKKQKGGACPKHVGKIKSVLVGATHIPHNKTSQKGGDDSGRTKTIGVTPYQRYNNGGSDRQAAMKATQDANAAQQKAIAHSGGRQRKTRKVKKHKRKKTRSKKVKKSKKHKKRHHKKKTKRVRKHLKHKKRGGSSLCGSGGSVVVPSFQNSGPSVGPITATKMSGSGNSSNLGAGCQAANDCYATNSCGKSGGSKRGFKNWYSTFPMGSFGSSMTGVKQKGGFIGERSRFDFIEYARRD